MFNQGNNNVKIEGILSEINLNEGSYTKGGKTHEMISGTIKVRVEQDINKVHKVLEVPVSLFANKYKADNSPNPGYDNLKRLMSDYVSIAAGGLEKADVVRLGGCRISMNEYPGNDGRIVSYPRINAAFVNKGRSDELKSVATFEVTMIIQSMTKEINSQGEETGRMKVVGLIPQYGNIMDQTTFYVASPSVIDAISTYWNINDTVVAAGQLDFSSKTETYVKDLGFGEPTEETRTINVSELIITGGNPSPLADDKAYTREQISEGLRNREAKLNDMKEKRNRKPSAPAPTSSSSLDNYGF